MTRRAVEFQPINLRALVRRVLGDFAPRASSRGVTLEALTFVNELSADPSLLHRLLTSLIDHAVRRAPDGTIVTLVASPRPGCVEFRVADEGPRLAPGGRRELFLSDAGGPKEPGLGGKDCAATVEAMGGKYWMGETAKGAVACVALPTTAFPSRGAPVRAKSVTRLRAAHSGLESAPQTILVVDDEPLIRTFVSRLLKERGYGVIEADCAEKAMDRLMMKAEPLALLLSDVGLPGISGADLARQAKLLHPALPTLLMSGTPNDALVREGVIRQGTELLQKPLLVAELSAKLEQLAPRRWGATAGVR